MISFKQYISEGRPTGQKRYQRDISKLETQLDTMYAAGGSQKKIDRAEMRLARKTNEDEFDIDDQRLPKLKSTEYHYEVEEHPMAMSLEELMREKARKIHTDNFTHEMVGAEIRSAITDLTYNPELKADVTDKQLGQEAHRILVAHENLKKRMKNK
jgi:hypothetical protein